MVVPATAYLANRFGSKRIYIGSLFLFTVGSALCGAAPNVGTLIAFRVLQGAGGAALFPLSFSLLFSVFPPEERGKANGIFGIPVLAAPALGPTIGGYLSEYVDWRWIFYVNVPVGIVGVIMGIRVLREVSTRRDIRFDFLGFFLAAAGLALLLLGLSNLAYDGWGSVKTVSGPIIVAVVLLAAFVPITLHQKYPLLNLRLYTGRNYAVGTAIILLATTGLFGPAFLLPQFLQILRGQTPFQAGLLLLWQGLGAVIGSIVSGQLYNRVGPKPLMVVGSCILVLTSVLLAVWSTATSSLLLLPLILLPRGVGLPLTLQSNTVALEGIRGPDLPNATTLNVVARNVMGSLAIAVLTNFLHDRTRTHLAAIGVPSTSGQPISGAHIPPPILNALAEAYQDTYVLATIAVLPILVLIWFLHPTIGRGAVVRNQAPRGDPPAGSRAVARG